jgi:hypothetical protein
MSRSDGPLFCLVEVNAGRLRLPASDRFAAQIRQLHDGDYEMVLERKRATRSHAQNRRYWKILLGLSMHTGNTKDELHDICKAKFLPKTLAICDGNGVIVGEFVIGGSTRKLTPQEFTDYMDAVEAWALTLGVGEMHA